MDTFDVKGFDVFFDRADTNWGNNNIKLLDMRTLAKITAAVAMFFAMSTTSYAATVSGQCGTNLYWSFDTETGALVITGYGDMDRGNVNDANTAFGCFDYETPVDYCRRRRNGQIETIRSGVVCTTGDWYRFGPVNYCLAPWSQYITQITSVTLPEGIKSIAGTAFHGASGSLYGSFSR